MISSATLMLWCGTWLPSRADWGGWRRVLVVRFLLAAYMTAWLGISIAVGGECGCVCLGRLTAV